MVELNRGERGKLSGRTRSSHSRTRQRNHPQLQDVYAVLFVAAGVVLAIAVLSQSAGALGRYGDLGLRYLVGVGRYLAPFILISWGIAYALRRASLFPPGILAGILIVYLAVLGLAHLSAPVEQMFVPEVLLAYGGYMGASIAYGLVTAVGSAAAYVVLIALSAIGLLLIAQIQIPTILARARDLRPPAVDESAPQPAVEKPSRRRRPQPVIEMPDPEPRAEPATVVTEPPKEQKPPPEELTIAPAVGDDSYQLPPLSLLKTSPSSGSVSKKDLNESISVLERTMKNFEVDAQVNKVIRGPTVTRFEISLGEGVKVNRIVSLSDDIALALATADIRILAPIPGKSAVGIEVPNRNKELVTVGDILQSSTAGEHGSVLTMGVGKDISGQPVLADIGDMPHLLIAGATGSGKSVCINSIVTSILMRARPSNVRMLMVDPKLVELTLYNGIPHLLTPVITNPKRAATALTWAVGQMEERFERLSEEGVRNIDAYNEQITKKEPKAASMPYILIVIDELADLMMTAAAEVEDAICRLAQMARAVGIHLVVATQRPSVDVITGLIKANITTRISFAVSSQTDSRVILDGAGAEKLVGKGDMLFQAPSALRPKRIQGAFVSEGEIKAVTEFIKGQAQPDYQPEILQDPKTAFGSGSYIDPLFGEAAEIVVTSQQASVSLIQRRLRVGYTRAARLVDQLEERGIVGGYEGSKPREVLLSRDEWERRKESQSQEVVK